MWRRHSCLPRRDSSRRFFPESPGNSKSAETSACATSPEWGRFLRQWYLPRLERVFRSSIATMRVRLFCLALCASAAVSLAGGAAPEFARARQLIRDLPVRFEPNLGQWNSNVKYFSRAGDSRLLLTSHEAILSVGGHEVGLSLLRSNPSARIS